MEIKGRDLVAGAPKTIEITSSQVNDALMDPLSEIVDAVRLIVRSADSDPDKLKKLVAYVHGQGLKAPEPVKPLPVIQKEEIRVVCWMAISNTWNIGNVDV